MALDVPDTASASALVKTIGQLAGRYKVGSELFTAEGPAVVRAVTDLGCEVFLDLKFHDIPNTVERAARNAAGLGVAMITVHASGGIAMIQAAARGVASRSSKSSAPMPKILAVTVLTSMDQSVYETEALGHLPIAEAVGLFARNALRAGADGVIASPQEIAVIRNACGANFLIGTPGVRPTWAEAGDQVRVMTPREAIKTGADFVVIGRPITQANSPADAARRILAEMSGDTN